MQRKERSVPILNYFLVKNDLEHVLLIFYIKSIAEN